MHVYLYIITIHRIPLSFLSFSHFPYSSLFPSFFSAFSHELLRRLPMRDKTDCFANHGCCKTSFIVGLNIELKFIIHSTNSFATGEMSIYNGVNEWEISRKFRGKFTSSGQGSETLHLIFLRSALRKGIDPVNKINCTTSVFPAKISSLKFKCHVPVRHQRTRHRQSWYCMEVSGKFPAPDSLLTPSIVDILLYCRHPNQSRLMSDDHRDL